MVNYTKKMKKSTVWILLVLYLHASAQMVMPLVQDCVAHLLFWHEHFEQVHHGHSHSDHVDHELEHLMDGHDDDHHAHSETTPSSTYLGKYVLACHLLAKAPEFLLRKEQLIFLTTRINRYIFFYHPFHQKVSTPPPELIG
jgi:hypothetical protein